MAALGDFEPLDVAIHADLGWERQATYEIRDWYTTWLNERGIKVEILDTGDIRQNAAKVHIHMPFWTETGGPLKRQCTRDFKIQPIKRRIRELLGYHPSKSPHPPAGACEVWIGISLDEYRRYQHSDVKFLTHRWPLLELSMTRQSCTRYLEEHQLPVPPKSACIGCPFRSATEWLELKRESPAEWEEAVAFDEANRDNPLADRGPSTADRLYIYKGPYPYKPEPLATADLEAHAALVALRRRRGKQLPIPSLLQ